MGYAPVWYSPVRDTPGWVFLAAALAGLVAGPLVVAWSRRRRSRPGRGERTERAARDPGMRSEFWPEAFAAALVAAASFSAFAAGLLDAMLVFTLTTGVAAVVAAVVGWRLRSRRAPARRGR